MANYFVIGGRIVALEAKLVKARQVKIEMISEQLTGKIWLV